MNGTNSGWEDNIFFSNLLRSLQTLCVPSQNVYVLSQKYLHSQKYWHSLAKLLRSLAKILRSLANFLRSLANIFAFSRKTCCVLSQNVCSRERGICFALLLVQHHMKDLGCTQLHWRKVVSLSRLVIIY